MMLAEYAVAYPWVTVGYLFWAIPKLDVEIHKWLTGIGYHGIGP